MSIQVFQDKSKFLAHLCRMTKLRSAPGMRERAPDVWELVVQAGRDPVTGKLRQVSRTFRGNLREDRRETSRVDKRVDHAYTVSQARDPSRFPAARSRRLAVLRVTAMTGTPAPRTPKIAMTGECTATRVCGGVW